jgi:hypothetical protein
VTRSVQVFSNLVADGLAKFVAHKRVLRGLSLMRSPCGKPSNDGPTSATDCA